MSTPALEEKDSVVVLFARVPKSQKFLLERIAKQKKISLNILIGRFIVSGIVNENYMRGIDEKVTSIEKILVSHSKQSIEDSGRILKIVGNIHSTQMGAKSDSEEMDVPEGVILLPPLKEDKKGVFYCQGCAAPTPNKRKHRIKVGEEEIVVGDCCFFNDHYKDLIKAIL